MDGICRANVGNDNSIENVKIEKFFFVLKPTKECLCTYQKKRRKEKKRIANLLLLTAV
jgi:hypothetical protein